MLKICNHQQPFLIDPWSHLGAKRKSILEKSWAGVFRNFLLYKLPVEELISAFCPDNGRPTKDIRIVVGALILQQMHDLTDRSAVEAISFNIMWHYSLNILNEEDCYTCERTFRTYRKLLIDRGLDSVIFKDLTDELLQKFNVDTSRQRLDSTSIRSAMRTLTRLGILVETMSKFLRELCRKFPSIYSAIESQIVDRYVRKEGDNCFSLTRPSETKNRLPEAAKDIYNYLSRFKDSEVSDLASYQLLERVFNEHIEVTGNGECPDSFSFQVRPPKSISCESVQNPSDPDASYNAHRGQGYMMQVMEVYSVDNDKSKGESDSADLITHVSVDKMTVHDSKCLEPALLETKSRGIKPETVLADSHYGSSDNLSFGAEHGTTIIAPSFPPKGHKQNRITLEQFELDEAGFVLSCPVGLKPFKISSVKSRFQANFERSICQKCSCLDRCPVRIEKKASRLRYTSDRVKQRKRRIFQESEFFKNQYRWRAGIEGSISRLKNQMKLGFLRVRGMRSVQYVCILRALGLNIFRCAKV
jgi:hypothetical protein